MCRTKCETVEHRGFHLLCKVVAYIGEEVPEGRFFFNGSRSIEVTAHRVDRGDRSIECANDLGHGNGVSGAGEPVAATFTLATVEDSGALELQEYLFEESRRDLEVGGDGGDRQALPLRVPGHADQGQQCVLASSGQFHGSNISDAIRLL